MSSLFADVMSVANIGCWTVCFWWMHRISVRQDAMLNQLQEQAKRIEQVSNEEHQILTQLRPSVEKIEKNLDEVSEKVASQESP